MHIYKFKMSTCQYQATLFNLLQLSKVYYRYIFFSAVTKTQMPFQNLFKRISTTYIVFFSLEKELM